MKVHPEEVNLCTDCADYFAVPGKRIRTKVHKCKATAFINYVTGQICFNSCEEARENFTRVEGRCTEFKGENRKRKELFKDEKEE